MNFNQGSNKAFPTESYDTMSCGVRGRLPQKTVVAITAYSCITFQHTKPCIIHLKLLLKTLGGRFARATELSCLRKKNEKTESWSLEERQRTSETGDGGARRERSPSLLCRDEPRAAYIDDGRTEEKFSSGITTKSRSKFRAQRKKKPHRRVIGASLWSCGHTHAHMHNT